ncbi:MAG: N-methyl-L-tryptophan oxidase [Planctomyces sp.]|nr:N-methyl-L-tryptophan oxidase [Planctomyces sp.]
MVRSGVQGNSFDVIVLGCGGFGSSAAWHLGQRGVRVLGIDQFSPPHDQGSSHGETRVIRKAYFEHPDYVPLLHRAYDLWLQLEQESQQSLFNRCGLLLAGPASGEVIAGARESARLYQLPIENLSQTDCRGRFPLIRVPDDLDIVFEADAGYLHAERCVEAHLKLARSAGVQFAFNEKVCEVHLATDSVRVVTSKHEYHAASLVVTGGAWCVQLLPEYSQLIRVRRKTLFWLPISDARWNDERQSTIHLMELPGGTFYGFPSVDRNTVKVAEHSGGELSDNADNINRLISEDDSIGVLNYVSNCLSGVTPSVARASVCMYSMSPDGHFLIDRLPDAPVVIAAGFSGHGFKFTSVIGQALADLTLHHSTPLPIQFLSRKRCHGPFW